MRGAHGRAIVPKEDVLVLLLWCGQLREVRRPSCRRAALCALVGVRVFVWLLLALLLRQRVLGGEGARAEWRRGVGAARECGLSAHDCLRARETAGEVR